MSVGKTEDAVPAHFYPCVKIPYLPRSTQDNLFYPEISEYKTN